MHHFVLSKQNLVQNDEAEDEEMMPEDSANDGFMVPDGQLSEDEGLSSMQQELDTLCADHEGELPFLHATRFMDCCVKELLSVPITVSLTNTRSLQTSILHTSSVATSLMAEHSCACAENRRADPESVNALILVKVVLIE